MKMEELLMKAREIAGFKPINFWVDEDKISGIYGNKISSYHIGLELESLIEPLAAKELIMQYISVDVRMDRWENQETPWMDTVGDTDYITLPVILINGEPAANKCSVYSKMMNFALEKLNPSEVEKNKIIENLEEINLYWDTFEREVGFDY